MHLTHPLSYATKLVFVEKHSFKALILKPTETVEVRLGNGTSTFHNSSMFERLASFYVTITRNFERFQYFDFEKQHILKNESFFQNTGVPFSS